jgi:hypothetical protein
MPIFARTKLVIHDYCLEPYRRIHLSYTGPNPQLSVEKARQLLAEIFKVKEEEIQERKFKWDRSGKVETFEIEWNLVKDLDKFSYEFIEFEMSGEVRPSEEFGKEGSVKISMRGAIRTEYPQDTIWQRSIIYEIIRVLFHKIVYQPKRKEYILECREKMMTFQDQLKQFFNILPKRV